VGQSSSGKDTSTEAKESICYGGSRYLATPVGDIEDVCCCTVICRACRSSKLL
jgi:hypothetical protein